MTATGYVGGDPSKLNATGYTKGDIVASNVAGQLQVVHIGTDGQVLESDSTATDGVSWQTGGGGSGTPSNTVVTETSYGQSSTAGAAATYSRGDHTHGSPPTPFTVLPYNVPGTVATAVGAGRIYNDSGRTLTILSVRASVGTAPTGQSLIVDVNVNGTTIFTTQANRPTIAAAGNTSGKVTNMDVTTIADGSYFTVDVDQVGSGTAGSDLTVQISLGG